MSPEPRFDEVVHAPQRLRIVAMLAPVGGLDFGVVRDALEVSDSVLSKHVKVLEDAGYVTVAKVRRGPHRWTTLSLTSAGRRAYAGHVAALRAIVEGSADGSADVAADVAADVPAEGAGA